MAINYRKALEKLRTLGQQTGLYNPAINQVQGYAHSGFEGLKAELARIHPGDTHGGAAIAVYFKGQPVADLWIGNSAPHEPWQQGSMALSYSTGKGVLATLTHIVVGMGLLSYDTPIVQYWPAFAGAKSNITLRHVLSHQAGLYDIYHAIPNAAYMLHWAKMCKAVELSTPRHAPNKSTVYHALTIGWIVGHLIERVTHMPLEQALKKHLSDAMGLDGAFFGVPKDELHRVARTMHHYQQLAAKLNGTAEPSSEKPNSGKAKQPSAALKLLRQTGIYDSTYARNAASPQGMSKVNLMHDKVLSACIPALNGVFTARSLAKVYAMLAEGGTYHDVTYIPANVYSQATKVQTYRHDKLMNTRMHWRLGYHRVFSLGKPCAEAFGHMGYNGSSAWCDPARELSFAYIHNYSQGGFGPNYRQLWLHQRVLQLADKALGQSGGWL